MKAIVVLTATAALQTGAAHTIFTDLNGQGIGNGVRVPSYNGPIQDVSSNSVACNGPPNPTTATNTVINVSAGSKATLQWRFTLNSAKGDVIDSSHKGPVVAYMKKVSDSKTDSGIGNGWFKIYEDGWDSKTDTWGVDRLIAAKGAQNVTIPSCITSGQYLLRGELIALHGASSSGGAQLYMECAQINVTGGSGAKSPTTVSFPGAYKADDPGILINIYYPKPTSYTIPGPKVFTC